MRRRWLPPVVAVALTLAALLPGSLTAAQFCDESWYLWGGHYYGQRVLALDYHTPGTDAFTDPGWTMDRDRVLSAPLGVQLYYAGVAALLGAPSLTVPFDADEGCWIESDPAQSEAVIPARTLLAGRIASVLASVVGITALAVRFGWAGTVAAGLLLLMPNVTQTLSIVMAEGPLVMGLGLSLLAFGSPWFPLALALAANMKLTALALWPLLLWPGASGRIRLWAVPAVALAWSVLNPASWGDGGPLYLLQMVSYRVEAQAQANAIIGGYYLPLWYLIPLQYALVIGVALLLPRSCWWPRRTVNSPPV